MYQKVVDLQFIRETAGLSNHRAFGVALRVVLRHIHVSFCTGKSLPEALLFGEHWENMRNCSGCQKQFLYTTCSPQV